MNLWKKILRPLLFRIPAAPETTHNLIIRCLGAMGTSKSVSRAIRKRFFLTDPALSQTVAGMHFPNPVGLAAGFDKNSKAALGLEALGFGFLELGTVTRYPQPGNPRPRLFRLEKDQTLINRMGFNNEGVDAIVQRLSSYRSCSIPIGISIGKSKITPLETAAEDYLYSFEKMYPYGDYFAVNVSSPNTPGLRSLQDKDSLDKILSALREARKKLSDNIPTFSRMLECPVRDSKESKQKPIFVKIAPDLTNEAIAEILEVCSQNSIDGIIAVNTTLSREGLSVLSSEAGHASPTASGQRQTSSSRRPKLYAEAGGLSGKPLAEKSRRIVSYIRSRAPRTPIIGVGGIFNGDDAYEMLKAGANLIQIYTGFIYGGPSTARNINTELLLRMASDSVKNISELRHCR